MPAERIFIRQCYRDLEIKVWSAFKTNERVEVALTGTPGIGKSMFGLYFLFKLVSFLKAENACPATPAKFGLGLNGIIVYEFVKNVGDNPDFWVLDVATRTIYNTGADVRMFTNDPRAFLVKDGPCQSRPVACSVLWVSSPRAGAFQKFKESTPGCRFVLPPWDSDELIECLRRGCLPFVLPENADSKDARRAAHEAVDALDDKTASTEATIRRWAADLGPVPRRMIDPAAAYRNLEGALRDLGHEDLDHLSRIAQSADGSGEVTKFKHSHRLLLMVPSDDLSTFNFVPSSVSVGRKILQLRLDSNLQRAESLLGQMTGAHRGLVFEPYAHHLLAAGGKWPIRNLAAGGRDEELDLGPLSTVEVSNQQVEDLVIEAGKYYVPSDPTYAVVDSWCLHNMFQITVGQDHPIASGAKQYTALKGKNFRRLIFVVPKALAATFPEQPLVDSKGRRSKEGPRGGWNDVPQFVLGL